MSSAFRLSVAVPLHNEESLVGELLRRLRAVLDSIGGGPHEIVLVDDGSTDSTLKLLEEAAAEDARLVVIALSRNFGHQAALTAALDHVSGNATVIMDGDLQDQPEAIPLFLERFWQGYDVVYAKRVGRKEGWLLRLCFYLFYRLLNRLSDLPLPVDAGDFSLISHRVVEELRRLPEHHRYLRGLRTWVGYKQIGIAVERSERYSGKSKYGAGRLLKLALDGVLAFSIIPLRAAAILGLLAITLSVLFAIYSLFAKFWLHQSPRGFTALTFLITFLSGANLLFLGIIGEYLGRVFEETKKRPLYVVDRVISLARRRDAMPRPVDQAALPAVSMRGSSD